MNHPLIATDLHYAVAGKPIISSVSLQLLPGEMVALIGPNGAGKSTLLRLLTGYLVADRGDCQLNGISLQHWPAQALSRQRAVMQQQSPLRFDWLVEAVIGMGRAPWRENPEPAIIHQAMQLTCCDMLRGRNYSTLSGGEKQRVQLARALVQLWDGDGPRGWLFLDEPTSALDLYYQQHLLRLLKRLIEPGLLHVCVVLHDLNLAALWADRILLLHQGSVVAQGTPQSVLQTGILQRWYGADLVVTRHPQQLIPQVFLAG